MHIVHVHVHGSLKSLKKWLIHVHGIFEDSCNIFTGVHLMQVSSTAIKYIS